MRSACVKDLGSIGGLQAVASGRGDKEGEGEQEATDGIGGVLQFLGPTKYCSRALLSR